MKGLSEKEGRRIAEAVAGRGAFSSIGALWRGTGVRLVTLRRLAEADGFGSMGLTRQSALWAIERLREERLPMFDGVIDSLEGAEAGAVLPAVGGQHLVIHDYAATGLSLKAHPLSFSRGRLEERGVLTAAGMKAASVNQRCAVAGLVLVRQRPATAGGVLFITLEDETGVANLIVRPGVYERYRRAIRQAVVLLAYGRVERQGVVTHLLVERAEDLRATLGAVSRDFH